jgi:hypothetical protein
MLHSTTGRSGEHNSGANERLIGGRNLKKISLSSEKSEIQNMAKITPCSLRCIHKVWQCALESTCLLEQCAVTADTAADGDCLLEEL